MISPIRTTFMYYPEKIWISAMVLVLINIVLFSLCRKRSNGVSNKKNRIIQMILVNYVYVLLFFTILGRRSLEYYRYNVDVGYSFRQAFVLLDREMLKEVIANIVVFIPIGYFIYEVMNKFGFLKTCICGFAISFIIEILQLVLKTGLCEIDDIISNTFGTFIGCCILLLLQKMKRCIQI